MIISDLSYLEVVSASSIVGGASQVSGTSTATTDTNGSSFTTKADLNIIMPDSHHTFVSKGMILSDKLNVERTLLD